jgi:Tfp pilus assembly protein FimT
MVHSVVKHNNKGYSLIELIVIVAIIAVMIGVGSLSLSLLTGSEARQACEKINSQLNEAKTGAMSRADEDLCIVYVSDPTLYEWADKEGYYAVKQMWTLGTTTSGGHTMPAYVASGQEHRYICNARVDMQLNYTGGNVSGVDGFGFRFDRSKGLYKGVKANCTIASDNSSVDATDIDKQPETLVLKSGLKTYTIKFYSATGKHEIVR